MITLPVEIKTTMLKSFWIVFCTVFLSIISLLLRYILDSNTFLFILFIIPIAILPGYLRPESIKGTYKLTNRILRKIVREFRGMTIKIIYYVFYFSFRPEGNEINFKDLRGESSWEFKKIEELSGYETLNEVAKDPSEPRFEFTPLIKWIYKSKKWSALAIVPFVFILSFLIINDEKIKAAENTYTLY